MKEDERKNKMSFLMRLKRSNPIIFWVFVCVFSCLFIIAIFLITSRLTPNPLEEAQQDLARELGVRIEDYPYPGGFPSGYFGTVLVPGMSISEVHNIVRGYKQVLHCGKGMEVYYYLTTDIRDTERFFIYYDEQGRYSRLIGEDNDSRRNIDGNWCSEGLLKE